MREREREREREKSCLPHSGECLGHVTIRGGKTKNSYPRVFSKMRGIASDDAAKAGQFFERAFCAFVLLEKLMTQLSLGLSR